MKKLIANFVRRFLKPFWFSSDCELIKVPYVYGMMVMIVFVASVVVFLCMAWSGRFSAGVLGSVSAVIATLAGLYFGIIQLYNSGKKKPARSSDHSETPTGQSNR